MRNHPNPAVVNVFAAWANATVIYIASDVATHLVLTAFVLRKGLIAGKGRFGIRAQVAHKAELLLVATARVFIKA